MSNRRPVHPDLAALIDKVWEFKGCCEDLEPRAISEPDAVTIASVSRDLDRLASRLVGIRDKRKRDKSDDNAQLGLGAEGE